MWISRRYRWPGQTRYLSDRIIMKKGFTLIELMVAVALFIVIMTISMGSILGVFDANRKSRALKTVLNNLNLATESMAKEMRFGRNYHCGEQGQDEDPRNCANGGDDYMSFLSSDGVQITYQLDTVNDAIEKQVGSGESIPITAPEIEIDSLTFFTIGAGNSGGNAVLQPKVIIIIRGHAGAGDSESEFTLQTLVSQRTLDI